MPHALLIAHACALRAGLPCASQLDWFWSTVPGRHSYAATWARFRNGSRYETCHTEQFAPLYAPLSDARLALQMVARKSLAACREEQMKSQEIACLRQLIARSYLPRKLLFPGVMVRRSAQTAPTSGPADFRPGRYCYGRCNASHHLHGAPSHRWVEVLRVARLDDKASRQELSAVGQVWFWITVGSGIWLNTGRTVVLHSEDRLDCWAARKQGFDTVQFPNAFGGFTYELKDCRGVGLADQWQLWEEACPPRHIRLRAGLPPTRYSPAISDGVEGRDRHCKCNASLAWLNCGSHARAPGIATMTRITKLGYAGRGRTQDTAAGNVHPAHHPRS